MTSWFLISPGAPKRIWSSFTTPNSQKSWSHAGKKPSICFKTIYLSGKRQWCFINLTCPKKHHMNFPISFLSSNSASTFSWSKLCREMCFGVTTSNMSRWRRRFFWISKRLVAWSKVREDTGEEGAWSGGKFRLESLFVGCFFAQISLLHPKVK